METFMTVALSWKLEWLNDKNCVEIDSMMLSAQNYCVMWGGSIKTFVSTIDGYKYLEGVMSLISHVSIKRLMAMFVVYSVPGVHWPDVELAEPVLARSRDEAEEEEVAEDTPELEPEPRPGNTEWE